MPFAPLTDLIIHYEHAGQGDKVIVFVHGNFASWRWWRPCLRHLLPSQYTAYALDLRGCGDSDQPPNGYTIQQLALDLYKFIQYLNLPAVHLVGHSLGGAVTLQFALDYPQKVRSLSLISPAPAEGMAYLQQQPLLSNPFQPYSNKEFHRLLHASHLNRTVLEKILSHLMPTMDIYSQEFLRLVDDGLRMSPAAINGFYQTLVQWSVQAELSRLQLPVLLLWGKMDVLISKEALERMVAGLPQVQWIVWENVGHAPQLEQPLDFRKLLLSFITSLY